MAVLLLLARGTTASGAVPAEDKCTAAKLQAFGKLVDARAKCFADARKRGRPVDPVCLAKAGAKLVDQFAKAEKETTCPGDATERLGAAAACVTSFDDAVGGDAPCVAAKLKAAGKKAAGTRACAKKHLLKGTALAPCLEKVELKFAKAVTKAESKKTCTGTVDGLGALVDACLAESQPPIACTGGSGHPMCDGACPDGLTCRAYEVFENGASVDAGCSCVDVASGPLCGGPTCGTDAHCDDPTHVCERWLTDSGCDHSICQPAMTTPTTLPPSAENQLLCSGGTWPTCGGTCPDGLRCQSFQAFLQDLTVFAECLCVDPAAPRCDAPADTCNIDVAPFSHCADPSLTCLVTIDLADGGQKPTCLEAHCGSPASTTTSSSSPPTTTTSSSTSTTTSSTTTTTTTTSTTLPCVSTPGVSGCFEDLGNCTIRDNCTGLQWEQKQNVAGPHHVTNRYVWAGCCEDGCNTICQPNAAAAATCLAMTEGDTEGCGAQCPTGECYVERGGQAITTIFDWINQLNAESFGGHSDWRLPSEKGFNPSGAQELSSILQHPCTDDACIDPIFGPTVATGYWSRTTDAGRAVDAWFVNFFDGVVSNLQKREALFVRAVRPAGTPD